MTHIVKTAEVQTGAGTATVTRALAEQVNEGAAPADVVSGEALRERVRNNTGERIRVDHPNTEPEQAKEAPVEADGEYDDEKC